MGFLDSLEKLINEHGSAAILKERIQLLNDRHSDIERKLKLSESENQALRSQVKSLASEIGEIRRLQHEADEKHQEQLRRADRLPADREAILKIICFHPDREPNQAASIAGLTPEITQWHIDALEKSKFVHVSYTVGTPWAKGGRFLTVTEMGRDYLAVNGMLQA